VPFQTLTKIYRSLIYPYLSYGLTAWGNAAQKELEKTSHTSKTSSSVNAFC
jgi:hypothetical protein